MENKEGQLTQAVFFIFLISFANEIERRQGINLLSRQNKRRTIQRVVKKTINYEKVISCLHEGQNSLLQAVLSGDKKYCALMAHRRYGKDFISFLILVICAIKYPGNYYIFAPFFRQAKEIVVDGKTLDGRPLVEGLIPRELLKNPNSPNIVNRSDWSIELFNGSKIFIRGADNPNSNVGVGARGIIYTEAALMKPGFYQYMKPAIDTVINKTGFGVVIFISTPRGKNNWFTQLFVDYFTKLNKNPKLKEEWYIDIQKASLSKDYKGEPVISKEQLEKEKLEMTPEMFEQEWECSCSVTNQGAWYAKELDRGYIEKRFRQYGRYEEIPGQGNRYADFCWIHSPLYIGWDIGKRDHSVLWFFQVNPHNGRIRFIHHYRCKGMGADHLASYIKKWCRKMGFTQRPLNILPHDGDNEEWLSSTKRSQYLIDLGLDVFVLSKGLLADLHMRTLLTQINSIRKNFNLVEIDTEECAVGIIKLAEYIKKFNKTLGEYIDEPDHDANDKASDDADSFRTAMIYYIEFLKDNKKFESDSFVIDDEFEKHVTVGMPLDDDIDFEDIFL